jgi:precorrin-2/cobalt-factor-2 C20-methyltransferase
MKRGKLYGVSVGPGDPELMTIKAYKTLQSCAVLAHPQTGGENRLALDIVSGLLDIRDKQIIPLDFLMSGDRELLEASHHEQAKKLLPALDGGLDVAMLNIGDASLYGTFSYINEIIRSWGYESETIPGVTSFCAVAAALNASLTQMKKPLHIIPASHGDLDEYLSLPGSKVLMKSGGRLSEVKRRIRERGLSASLVANCGRKEERVFENINDASDQEGYFATILIRD